MIPARRKIFEIRQSAKCSFGFFCRLSLTILFLFVLIVFGERLPVKTYTVADGLLRDTVYKIKQDSRGFLWFCTAEGISRFDGYGFVNFTAANGLPPGQVNDLLETKNGTIYIATIGGLARLNRTGTSESSLFTILLPENIKAKQIEVLFQDRDGAVWVGTSGGLYQLNEDGFNLVPFSLGAQTADAPQLSVAAIIQDHRGALWFGTEGAGVFRLLPNGSVERYTQKANGLPHDDIVSLFEDSDGRIWAGNGRSFGGLSLFVAEPSVNHNIVERNFTTKDGLTFGWINSIFETSEGKFLVAATGGLCEWQGADAQSVCRTYIKENDLCDGDVWTVTEDKDANLWTGSKCGAKKWSRYGFTSYGEPDGIPQMQINSIFENRNGELFATIIHNKGRWIYRFEPNGKFTGVRPNLPPQVDYWGWGWKQTVWQNFSGEWLIPTGYGLFKFPAVSRLESLAAAPPQKISPATKGAEIFRLFEDSRGNLWIATSGNSNGLWRWDKSANHWQDFTTQIIPAPNRIVTSFVEDQSGSLWIGTGADEGGELIRYRDGQFKIFTEADGLPDGWIRDLFVDDANKLWIANPKNGLLRLDDVNADKINFVRYTNADGLSSAGAYCVTEDAMGRIYVGSARGVDRLNPDTGQIENFTTADGLPASYVEIAYRDHENNLWFGTANGLTRYVPEPKRQRQPPTALIMAVRVNGEPKEVSILGEKEIPNVELNSDQRQLSIDFLGLGANLGEKLKYEYRLGNDEWTRTGERTVNFANLAPGDYKFEIRAVTADGIYSSPAAVSFKIAAPLYLRWWFILSAIFFVVGVALLFYRYRVSRLLEMERMRTRIATDLHDDIGANLTKISILSEVAQQRLTSGANGLDNINLLSNIAETSRESVSAMGDIVWAINPKKDSYFDLIIRMRRYAEETLGRREILFDFNVPQTIEDLHLSADTRRNIYLIFKESLNNIVRHSAASKAKIDFRLENSELILEISDNGRGFDANEEFDGNGLPSIKKRAAELSGNLKIDSTKDKGAKITLRFKLSHKFWE